VSKACVVPGPPGEQSTWSLYQKVFLGGLRARNLSPKTVEACGEAISQFGVYLRQSTEEPNPEAVTADDVRGFITVLLERWTASTAHNRYCGLNACFKRLVEHDYMTLSPAFTQEPGRPGNRSVVRITSRATSIASVARPCPA